MREERGCLGFILLPSARLAWSPLSYPWGEGLRRCSAARLHIPDLPGWADTPAPAEEDKTMFQRGEGDVQGGSTTVAGTTVAGTTVA